MSSIKRAMENKLEILCEEYGFDDALELCEEFFNEGCVPAICFSKNCDATFEYEPDCQRGYCEECGKNSVISAMILLGVI